VFDGLRAEYLPVAGVVHDVEVPVRDFSVFDQLRSVLRERLREAARGRLGVVPVLPLLGEQSLVDLLDAGVPDPAEGLTVLAALPRHLVSEDANHVLGDALD